MLLVEVGTKREISLEVLVGLGEREIVRPFLGDSDKQYTKKFVLFLTLCYNPSMGKKKFYPSEEFLRLHYEQWGLTIQAVANLCELSRPTIRKWLDTYGIPRRKTTPRTEKRMAIRLLEYLRQREGQIVLREELIDYLWQGYASRSAIFVQVFHARQQLAENEYIVTARGGYVYIVTRLQERAKDE